MVASMAAALFKLIENIDSYISKILIYCRTPVINDVDGAYRNQDSSASPCWLYFSTTPLSAVIQAYNISDHRVGISAPSF